MTSGQTYPWPEWKRLHQAITSEPNMAEPNVQYEYDKLNELSGIDVRTLRGRTQFYKCQKELLKTHDLWLENVPKVGYRVILASEHGQMGRKRVKRARNQLRRGKDIVIHTRIEALSNEQRAQHADELARLSRIEDNVNQTLRQVTKIANAIQQSLPSPLLDRLLAERSESESQTQ